MAESDTSTLPKPRFTAHQALDGASVRHCGEMFMTARTFGGAELLANLLNLVDNVARAADCSIGHTPAAERQMIASACARAMGWHLETPKERQARLDRNVVKAPPVVEQKRRFSHV
jgi:hypothetical protein